MKTTGDGMLVEFAAAQDAVRCAIDVQTAMAERERASPMDRRIIYRVGINPGDVVFDEGDVFGDGVNVASRLQGLAQPGGVYISDIVLQWVGDRIREPLRDMGRQRVKNPTDPGLAVDTRCEDGRAGPFRAWATVSGGSEGRLGCAIGHR